MKKTLIIIGVILLLALVAVGWILYPFSFSSARSTIGEKKVITVGERQVAYYSNGNGPRVVLAASLGREASDFNELVQNLNSAGFRTICVEAPGIGDSDLIEKPTSLYEIVKDIKAVIDQDITNTDNDVTISLIGHAFGNRVMRAVASKYPQLAESVVLIAAGGQRRPTEAKVGKAIMNSLNPFLPVSRREKAISFAFFANGNIIPDYWIRGWHLKTAMMQLTTLEHTENTDWQDGGGLPMLIIQALEDVIAPKDDSSDVLKDWFGDRVEVVSVEKAGHALLPEQPEKISTSIIEFLNRLNSKKNDETKL